MSIETLLAIPQMIRDEDKGRFVYEDAYRDQVFIFGNEYLYFHETSYDRVPRQIIDLVAYNAVAEHIQQITITEKVDAEPSSENISTSVINYFQENGTKLSEAVKDMVMPEIELIKEEIYGVINNSQINEDNIPNIDEDSKQILQMCVKELASVKERLAQMNMPAVPTEIPSSKVNIGLLLALKESGYSVEDIKQLKSDGLI